MPTADGTRLCSACQAVIPSDAGTLGLCPVCLIRTALGGNKGAGRRFEAPPVHEVQAELEQLDVLELVGVGGMGCVYKAKQRSLDRLVAVKVFPREMWDDEEFEKRFRHEARLMASLNHPNIVTAHEYGESDAYYYLLMELVRGRSLRQVLRDGGRLTTQEALDVAVQVCDALEFAHAHGVIHRDIKPENILMEVAVGARVGRVRVADFGLAKLVGTWEGDTHRLGTPGYMAPEQREWADGVDGRADVYAVGVMLHEMLTGKLPSAANVRSPDGRLGRVIRKCLERDPAARYQRIPELRRDLAELRGTRQWAKWTAVVALAAVLITAGAIRWHTARASQGQVDWPVPSRPITGPTVIVHVDGIPAGLYGYVPSHLKDLTAAATYASSERAGRATVVLATPRPLDDVARAIDFGTITRRDLSHHAIDVKADPARMPKPLPAPVINPEEPNFYVRNLEDLKAWDPIRRRDAATRLRLADPTQLKDEIRTALEHLLKDPEYYIRREAADALATWGTPASIPALEGLSSDERAQDEADAAIREIRKRADQ